MNSVTQIDPFGCGIACISAVTGKNYKDIVSSSPQYHERARSNGFYCRELQEILRNFGLAYDYCYLKPKFRKKIYQDGVIVFVSRSKQYPSGHFLARKNSLWMDPWINFPGNKDISQAVSGFRKRLPGKPIYALFPKESMD